ncbi:uncharacterized protein LOC101779458 [Setaria italica]|uniref:uncharacterized protein LOC101779458 n=1 Tax=Setaria italica TaxID=4555 RepID=UPI000BE4E7AA|nr:uncharacterized protein LOC101779458 [Setaria italica]
MLLFTHNDSRGIKASRLLFRRHLPFLRPFNPPAPMAGRGLADSIQSMACTDEELEHALASGLAGGGRGLAGGDCAQASSTESLAGADAFLEDSLARGLARGGCVLGAGGRGLGAGGRGLAGGGRGQADSTEPLAGTEAFVEDGLAGFGRVLATSGRGLDAGGRGLAKGGCGLGRGSHTLAGVDPDLEETVLGAEDASVGHGRGKKWAGRGRGQGQSKKPSKADKKNEEEEVCELSLKCNCNSFCLAIPYLEIPLLMASLTIVCAHLSSPKMFIGRPNEKNACFSVLNEIRTKKFTEIIMITITFMMYSVWILLSKLFVDIAYNISVASRFVSCARYNVIGTCSIVNGGNFQKIVQLLLELKYLLCLKQGLKLCFYLHKHINVSKTF